MENKNFEKKKADVNTKDKFNFDIGYNTCLDRTNAKGIYEAGKDILKAIDLAPKEWLMTTELGEAVLKLQTELQKAETQNNN